MTSQESSGEGAHIGCYYPWVVMEPWSPGSSGGKCDHVVRSACKGHHGGGRSLGGSESRGTRGEKDKERGVDSPQGGKTLSVSMAVSGRNLWGQSTRGWWEPRVRISTSVEEGLVQGQLLSMIGLPVLVAAPSLWCDPCPFPSPLSGTAGVSGQALNVLFGLD